MGVVEGVGCFGLVGFGLFSDCFGRVFGLGYLFVVCSLSVVSG